MAATDDESRTAPPDSPVARAFRLLQLVVGSDEPLGVRELARRSGLPRSTVGRLVVQLADLGMVERTEDAAVVAGPALVTLQPGARSGSHLPARLRPLLHELVATYGENAALSIDDGEQLLYIAEAATDHAVTVPDVSGQRHHFHLVAPGLVTMAFWPTQRLDNELQEPLHAATANSVTDPTVLRRRLADIVTDGWCWTDQELDIGVNGLAVPILIDGSLVATVSLFGPTYRFSPATNPSLGPELALVVAARATELLG